ncbi:MAG: DUF1330 domain-containing protein [Candidatus Binataceae bacterium]
MIPLSTRSLAGFMGALAPFEGRVLVASEDVEVLEGTWPRTRTVVLEFPSMGLARGWYESSDYQAIAQHRFKAARTNLILVGGYDGLRR